MAGNLLLELRQKKATALDAADGLIATIGTAAWTDEQTAQFNGFKKDAEDAQTGLTRLEQRSAMGNISTDQPGIAGREQVTVYDNQLSKPWGYDLIGREAEHIMERRPGKTASKWELKQWRDTLGMCFGEYLRENANAFSVGRGGRPVDARLLELDAMERRALSTPAGASEAIPSDGGFLIAPDFASEVLTLVHETGIIYPLVREFPISANTNTINIPAVDERSRQDGYRWGGVQGFWENEAQNLTGSKPTFSLITLVLKKLTGLFYATNEVLADARLLGMLAMQGFAEEFGFKLDDGIINGTGAGQLLGLLNSNAEITVAAGVGQVDLLTFENVKAMWTRMWPRSRKNAIWLINQDLEASLMGLAQVVGTGGIPVYLPPGSVGGMYGAASAKPICSNVELNDVNGMLMGRPVVIVEQCQTAGTTGDIILTDPEQYILATKGGMQTASSIHVRFLTDEQTFRMIERVDGQTWWKQAVTPAHGSNTMSPIITLAARV